MFSRSFSRTALWLIGILLLAGLALNPRWKRAQIIKGDVVQYYAYLPATFIHGDLSMRYAASNAYYGNKMWGERLPSGGFLQKYTCGHALMMAPFFLLSHAIALAVDAPPDGYSVPYHFGIALASAFYAFFGFMILRWILLRHFSQRVTGLTLLLLLLGSNLLYYTSIDAGMPHSFLFFLLTLFAWLTLRFHETAKLRHALLLSAVGGLAFLVRPPHLLLWVLVITYGITSWGTLQEKLSFFRHAGWRLLVLPLGSVALFFVQMMYWRSVTGEWIKYSYGDEHFFWGHPMMAQVLFSFRKGWLVYTPLMAFALLGFVWLARYTRAWALPVTLITGMALLVVSSWWCWWYGGTLGMRPMIDYYGLLALPLGAFLSWMAQRKLRRAIVVVLMVTCVAVNLAETVQYVRGVLHHDSMTFAAWKRMWTTSDRNDPSYVQLMSPPNTEAAKKGDRNFW